MRRPLKPFVTEYKGTRRQAPSLQSHGLQPPSQPGSEPARPNEDKAFETERSRPRPVDLASREDSDDSYEAAMRAADALFARPTPRPAAGALTASEPSTEGTGTGSSAASAERGGRILRALDEPPPPQLVALEAAHAPKRRGRKPGSKNKPKIKPVELEPAAIEPLAAASAPSDTPASEGHHPGVFEDPAPLAVRAAHSETAATLRKVEAITSPSGAPSNGSKRFPWVRDRLKPGEGWKRRRLPRICW